MQSKESFQEQLMPKACAGDIDLIHVDKGKALAMGKYPDEKKGNLKDQACLLAKEKDYPYDTLEIKVNPSKIKTRPGTDVDFFAVTHHGLPIRIHPWVGMAGILYALPAQKGMRFDVGFNGYASCKFEESDPPYIIQTPMRKEKLEKGKVTENEDFEARHSVIRCKGSTLSNTMMPTADKLDRATQVFGKKRSKMGHGSVLKEFVDAGKWRKDNNTRFVFHDGGTMTFVPNYFTEQWFMVRGGGQMKKKDVFGGRKTPSGLISKLARLEREIEYLFDGGEWKTIVDLSGDGVLVGSPSEIEGDDRYMENAKEIGQDPNSYVIHKAFIDPMMIDEVSFINPRHGKVKTATVKVKPNTRCEIRTNFKRRPATIVENILFCTELPDQYTFDEKAKDFMDNFEDRLDEMEKLAKRK